MLLKEIIFFDKAHIFYPLPSHYQVDVIIVLYVYMIALWLAQKIMNKSSLREVYLETGSLRGASVVSSSLRGFSSWNYTKKLCVVQQLGEMRSFRTLNSFSLLCTSGEVRR